MEELLTLDIVSIGDIWFRGFFFFLKIVMVMINW